MTKPKIIIPAAIKSTGCTGGGHKKPCPMLKKCRALKPHEPVLCEGLFREELQPIEWDTVEVYPARDAGRLPVLVGDYCGGGY